jgi:hypothetical protein
LLQNVAGLLLQVRKYVTNRHPIPNQTQEKQLEDTQIAIGP